ncbi:MAG: DUF2111 domain-containing protein [Candidatus Verstraetearchaeota archaeon]|jgi:hypothetical protein|nr:DUF2111 domain-containing protein [Candidatus Verstraetearchaeota archaeon]
MVISKDSSAQEIAPLALAIHELCGLPLTMRTKNKKGVRVEDHKVVDYDYTGPVLEEVLEKGVTIKKIPDKGPYKGVPVIVVPIKIGGETVAAIGIVDETYGVFSEAAMIGKRRPKP